MGQSMHLSTQVISRLEPVGGHRRSAMPAHRRLGWQWSRDTGLEGYNVTCSDWGLLGFQSITTCGLADVRPLLVQLAPKPHHTSVISPPRCSANILLLFANAKQSIIKQDKKGQLFFCKNMRATVAGAEGL
jgi:hypothetical protein